MVRARPPLPSAPVDVWLQAGHAERIGHSGLELTLMSVRNDSRCPVGTACASAGDAEVHIQANQSSTAESIPLVLHTIADTNETTVFKSQIKLLELKPRPEADRPVDSGAYSAKVLVTPFPNEAKPK
jgi:hypothetical protein